MSVKWPALCLNYQLLGARYADERDVGGMGRGRQRRERGKEELSVKRRGGGGGGGGGEGEGEEILKGGWMEGWGMRGTGGMSERDRAA